MDSQPKLTPKSESFVNSLYTKYLQLSEDDDFIDGNGMMAFLNDAKIDATGMEAVVFCYILQLEERFTIQKKELENCILNYDIQNISGFKKEVEREMKKFKDQPDSFKDFYYYVFDYLREPEANTVLLDYAVPYLQLILSDRYKHAGMWCEFLQNEYKKSISNDTWKQFYQFIGSIKDDFSNFDEDGAWPSVVDDYVEYAKEKLNN